MAPRMAALFFCLTSLFPLLPAAAQDGATATGMHMSAVNFRVAETAAKESSSAAPSLSSPEPAETSNGVILPPHVSTPHPMRPFSAVAFSLRAGTSGAGMDVAVPLSKRLNLRAGGDYLSLTPSFNDDGMQVSPDVQLRSAYASLDVFPFNGGFHVSPGLTFYNGSHLSATALVPGGESVDLGDGTYYSDPNDPIHGTFNVSMGNKKMAPRLTMGWGNMIPRKGGHWSFPFEFGAEYIRQPPTVAITLAGTACQGPGACGQIQSDPSIQSNVAVEEQEINSEIPSWLRFYPLVSFGVSFSFGHFGAATR